MGAIGLAVLGLVAGQFSGPGAEGVRGARHSRQRCQAWFGPARAALRLHPEQHVAFVAVKSFFRGLAADTGIWIRGIAVHIGHGGSWGGDAAVDRG